MTYHVTITITNAQVRAFVMASDRPLSLRLAACALLRTGAKN